MSHFDIMAEDHGDHFLLEPRSPAYSNATVRRALLVWLHFGQRNEFKHVCNYYHYLESLEKTLPAKQHATSRLQEFKFLSETPSSFYNFRRLFPKLYSTNEGFHKIKTQNGVTTTEIFKASQIVRDYCRTHMIPLKKFLDEFQDFIIKCKILNTVNNMIVYINNMNVKDEIETWKSLPKHFSFLDIEVSEDERTIDENIEADVSLNRNNMRTLIKSLRSRDITTSPITDLDDV